MGAIKYKHYSEYFPIGASYYEWYNYIYKQEHGKVYFRMIGTWQWYESCITPIELHISICKGAVRRIK